MKWAWRVPAIPPTTARKMKKMGVVKVGVLSLKSEEGGI
jgi:hypothetical protein